MPVFRHSREIPASPASVFENAQFAENLRGFLEKANAQNLDRLSREVGAGGPGGF
ncbi:MAG: hypothetical protein HGA66_03910 [Holophaga sp.]|nr:hypothetical protein [Holophaga sp.]